MPTPASYNDPALVDAYTDVDERRTITDQASGLTVTFRYVHGGFAGGKAKFSFYFPDAESYRGRFFQHTYPTFSDEDATADTVAFAISNGAYVVSTNNGGGIMTERVLAGYRVNAAAAWFSRSIAAGIYGDDAPIRGYIYGGSGGAFQTMGALQNTTGVWEGGVAIVPGVPNAIPSFQSIRVLALRVLRDRLAGIADAVDAGGSGDPFAGLNAEQRAVLDEVTKLGFPPRGWWQHATLDGGAFSVVTLGVRALDPTYVEDFWNVPGYEGANRESSVHAARIQFETTVVDVAADSVTLAAAPDGDLAGADLVFAGGLIPGVVVSGGRVAPGLGAALGVFGAIAPGDAVRIDNSWFLALQYYQRHQVPESESDQYGWNQYCDDTGTPKYPQRAALTGPGMAAMSGGIPDGRFNGKMIMLASVLDVQAFPWAADWYQDQARTVLGDEFEDYYRLWYMDNCDHDRPPDIAAEAHLVSYYGEMQQALLDLDDWVGAGVSPPQSSNYQVTADNQIVLAPAAEDRRGVQPVVDLSAGSGRAERVDVAAGETVEFILSAQCPPGTGEIVRVEWDFAGTGVFTTSTPLQEPSAQVEVSESHTFAEPGTHFVVARATAHRDGDPDTRRRVIQNLDRVRVVVTAP
jgi:hypothetical protein